MLKTAKMVLVKSPTWAPEALAHGIKNELKKRLKKDTTKSTHMLQKGSPNRTTFFTLLPLLEANP